MNFVYGTSGHDIMFATDGSDWIYGLVGRDSIHGLGGKDIFVLAAADDKEFIIDFQDGSDLVDLRQVGVRSFAELELLYEYETDIVETAISPMRLYLNLMNDPEGRVDIDATDFIYAGTPVIDYTDGSDLVRLISNVYSVHFGGNGTDTLDLAGLLVRGSQQGVRVEMDQDQLGNGKFVIGGVTQHFFDFENITGTGGLDVINGDTASNKLFGLYGSDVLNGGFGNDSLLGHQGADVLTGGAGHDVLVGGPGYDKLWGGTGEDIFVFYANDNRVDLVGDYQDGLDKLHVMLWGVTALSQLTITELADGNLRVSYQDNAFDVRAAGGGDLSASDLGANDFIFA